MKKLIGVLSLIAIVNAPQAQEALSREDALKCAFAACLDLTRMRQSAIPTDPDVKIPIVLREEQYGCMLLPESKLTLDRLDQSNGQVIPIGQLWLHKLAPLKEDSVIRESLYHVFYVRTEEGILDTLMFALGFRKTTEGNAELLLFGKAKEPLLVTPAKAVAKDPRNGMGMSIERLSDRGVVTLNILGRYEASLELTDPEQF